jgi:hypothetical protein
MAVLLSFLSAGKSYLDNSNIGRQNRSWTRTKMEAEELTAQNAHIFKIHKENPKFDPLENDVNIAAKPYFTN